jgi:exopolyphosphatase/guanosine-5'-triphosphate,3'-diphosphate pyrophosphatase
MKYAAIDIGSNAARLFISEVRIYSDGSPDFTKVSLVRVPLRLGFEVFETGEISPVKSEKLLQTIHAYKHLLDVFDVDHCEAVATSAMRDAKNGLSLVKRIKKETNIDIQIISGKQEAELLLETQLRENFSPNSYYLYADVGGGSTEITVFKSAKILAQESFNVGTIRWLKDKVQESELQHMQQFIKKVSKKHKNMIAVGSGGNINKVFSISKQKHGTPLGMDLLRFYYKDLKKMSVQDRIHNYKLRHDRADVIVPALKIYLSIMKWGSFSEILVPQVGLVDGIIKKMYTENSFTALKGKLKS